MKKTILIVSVAVILILALLVFGFPVFSRLYYGRSQAATLFAWQLEKDVYTSAGAFDAYLDGKELENAEFYTISDSVTFTVPITEQILTGMQYYIINEQETPEQLLFYFPGGSYIDQPRDCHWTFLNQLAEDAGAMIVVPIYSKLPETNAETCYGELMDFYEAFVEEHTCGELMFMGDSAGGGMALSLAMQVRDAGLDGPDEIIALCPWVDITMSNPEISDYEEKDPALDSAMLAHLGLLWADDLSTDDPMVSPLFGSFENLGHITLITSTGELLYPDIMRMDAALTNAGIDHDTIVSTGMFHVWPLYLHFNIPESQATYEQIVAIFS